MKSGTPFERANLFGGTGTVRIWNLLGAASAPPFTAVLSCSLEPSGHVGAHRQEQFPEIVIGVSGTGTAWVNKVAFSLTEGAVIHLPHGAILEIRNLSPDAQLDYLIIKAS